VTLDSSGKDLMEAKEQSDQQVKALLDVCKQKGIQGADVDVGVVRISDSRTSDAAGHLDPNKPFTVTRVVTLRERDLRQFTAILETLSRGRATRVRYNVVSSKTDDVTRDTLVKATQAAKDKAAAMVGVLGARLGKVLRIDEYPPSGQNIPDEKVPVDQGSSAFGADAEKVRITVYVTFEIQETGTPTTPRTVP
jgi:uncharacterized protein YggE